MSDPILLYLYNKRRNGLRCTVSGRVQRLPQTAISIWYDGAYSDVGSGRCQDLRTGCAGHRCREVGCSLRPNALVWGQVGTPPTPPADMDGGTWSTAAAVTGRQL